MLGTTAGPDPGVDTSSSSICRERVHRRALSISQKDAHGKLLTLVPSVPILIDMQDLKTLSIRAG